MNTWKIILATLVIFGAGVVTGTFSSRVFRGAEPPVKQAPTQRQEPTPNPRLGMNRPEFVLHLKKRLELTPEQINRIETLIRESQERTKPVWESIKPDLRDEINRLRNEIAAELTPEQQARFEKIMRERRRSDDDKHRNKDDDDSDWKKKNSDGDDGSPPRKGNAKIRPSDKILGACLICDPTRL